MKTLLAILALVGFSASAQAGTHKIDLKNLTGKIAITGSQETDVKVRVIVTCEKYTLFAKLHLPNGYEDCNEDFEQLPLISVSEDGTFVVPEIKQEQFSITPVSFNVQVTVMVGEERLSQMIEIRASSDDDLRRLPEIGSVQTRSLQDAGILDVTVLNYDLDVK